MNLNQNPFSFYDFLGYLVPGVVLLTSFSIWAICEIQVPLQHISSYNTLAWIIPITFAITSYVLGFSLSIVSSLIIEHYLILRKNYPSKYRFKKEKCKSLFYKSKKLSCRDFICIVLVLPIFLFDIILGKLLGLEKTYYKSFSKQEAAFVGPIILTILGKVGLVLKTDLADTEFNWHQYIYHYIYENETKHAPKIQNYVALYGFSRTCSMVFLLLAWVTPIAFLQEWVHFSLKECIWHVVLFSSLAYCFFFGFVKFYRRYTDEILMAAVALEAKHQHRAGEHEGANRQGGPVT